MSTATFDKQISIKDDRAIDVLLKGLEEQKGKNENTKDVSEELNRSKEILKQSYCRSKA